MSHRSDNLEASSSDATDAAGDEPEAERPVDENSRPALTEMEELRRLLITPEQTRIEGLKQRLDDLELPEVQTQVVSRSLSAAVVAAEKDDNLAGALVPTMEHALKISVHRDPRPLTDALFPIIGPAIRKSIADALNSLLESINRTLENSLSLESLRWRLEALQTGRPFSEVALRHTLLFRVEQVFLIDRNTGLPLQHLVAEEVQAQDGGLVSSMLTAIQDFVQDSLGAAKEDVLDVLKMGDLTVMLEDGPQALIAAVIRGLPDPDLRDTLKDIIERIHLYFGDELDNFDGDTAPFDRVVPILNEALRAQYRRKERKTSPMTWFLIGAVLLLLMVWTFFSVRDRWRWDDYVDALQAEPGIVVVEEGREGGGWYVKGLRDPLSTDPDTLFARSLLHNHRFQGAWEPYQALAPEILVRRATRLLQAPATVVFRVEGEALIATGTASAVWVDQALQRIPYLSGVTTLDASGLRQEGATARALGQAAERLHFRFGVSGARLLGGQEAALSALIDTLTALQAAAEAAGFSLRVQLLGHASADGPAAYNLQISRQRAETMRGLLIARGIPSELLEPVGTGGPSPPTLASEVEEPGRSHSVSLRVVLE